MNSDEELALIKRCLSGDPNSFGPLVDSYQKPIFNVSLRMLGDPQDAEDVSQSVFIKAYENLASYKPKHKFFNWIYRMAINESINLLKQKKRFTALDSGYEAVDASPDISYESAELSEQIGNSLMYLNPDYRIVIILRHLQFLSYREMAYILDIPEKTVKSRLFTARILLKDILLKKGIVRND